LTRASSPTPQSASAWSDDHADGSSGGLSSGTPFLAPDEAARCREFFAQIEQHPQVDALDREVLNLLAHGHNQREIARLVGRSEPVISTRVAKLRAITETLAKEDAS
jgi:DNA-binding CsgD family transcriptional regulator